MYLERKVFLDKVEVACHDLAIVPGKEYSVPGKYAIEKGTFSQNVFGGKTLNVRQYTEVNNLSLCNSRALLLYK